MTIGSPPVLVEVIESFRSTFTCEYPEVEAEGPRDKATFSISVEKKKKNTQRSNLTLWRERSVLQDGESVCGFDNLPGG